MFQVSIDESGQILAMSYSRYVAAEEMRRSLEMVRKLLNKTQPSFQLLTNLSGLESMETTCAPYIAEIMNLCNARQVKTVVCVIPDPQKDIGYNLISLFHYDQAVKLRTYDNLADAIVSLST